MRYFALFFILLHCFIPAVFAADQAVKIREATYLFEMKGEYADAEAILEEVSKTGDAEDRAQADFLLGKIKDIAGNSQMASFYYKQNLRDATNASQIYWTAERLASIDKEPERLLENVLKLRSPMRQIFNTDSMRILLGNRTYYTPSSGKYTKLPEEIPSTAKINNIAANGIWWQDDNKLNFTPLRNIFPAIEIPTTSKIASFKIFSNFSIGFIDGEQFVLHSGNTERFRTDARYKDCEILESQSNSEPILLNCPDNALHIISKNDGHEQGVISMLDPISKVYQDQNGLLLFSGDAVWFFAKNKLQTAAWRRHGISVEEILSFGNYFAILESSGELSLIHKRTGEIILHKKTFAANLLNLNTGLLGLISTDGAIVATDTLLQPLWMFHIGEPYFFKPWVNDGKIYYSTSQNSLKILNALHYGKKSLLSQEHAYKANRLAMLNDWESAMQFADSSLAIEPGNAEALFLKALSLEDSEAPATKRRDAWAKVIRITSGTSEQRSKILSHYSKIINAKNISPLPLSPHTLYPNFIAYKKYLLTLDPASRQIIALNAETGDAQWTFDIGKMESAPVTANSGNLFAFASGFALRMLNIDKPTKTHNMELPGKPFYLTFGEKALYVSTWNGFLLKIMLPDFKLAWTRKIGTTPLFINPSKDELIITSLTGTIQHIWETSGQKKTSGPSLQAQIAQTIQEDSLLILISSDQRIFAYTNATAPFITISPAKDILSVNLLNENGKKSLLASFADQELRLYSIPEGEVLWSYQGKKSLFGKIAIANDIAWIDQGEELVGIDIKTGKMTDSHSIPGGAGTPFIVGQTLYTATPQHLLYSFNLP